MFRLADCIGFPPVGKRPVPRRLSGIDVKLLSTSGLKEASRFGISPLGYKLRPGGKLARFN